MLALLNPNALILFRTITTTVTVTVTAPAVKLKRAGFKAATTIYAGSPVTIVGPDATSVVLDRRMVEARATSAPPPSCLPQYSAEPARLTSACNCLSITSSTLSTVSTAPTITQVSFLLFLQSLSLTCLWSCGADNSKDLHGERDIYSQRNINCRSSIVVPKLQCLLI